MRFRMSHIAAAIAVAVVLGLAVVLFIWRSPVDAVLMIFIVSGLAAVYALRRYARAETVYRRTTTHRPERAGEPPRDAGRPPATASGSGPAAPPRRTRR